MKEYLIDASPDLNFDDYNNRETLTVVYPKVSREVKDDFYNNKFNGEVSKFYLKGKDIICGVLANSVEKTLQSGKVVKGCAIYGIYYNRNRYENLTPLLKKYIFSVKMENLAKIGKPYKQKYFFVEAIPVNEEQRELLKSVGFHQEENSEKYSRVI